MVFTLNAGSANAGKTYSFEISGVDASEIEGGQLLGTVTVDSDGVGLIPITPRADSLTEGSDTLTLTVAGKTASVVVNDTSLSAAQNSSFTVTAAQIAINNAVVGANAMTVEVGSSGPKSVALQTDAITSDGGFIVDGGNSDISVTAGSKGDTLVLVSDGDNVISVGAGSDNVTVLGAGKNTINVGTGSDVVVAGSGDDTIVFASGDFKTDDVVDGGLGFDTVVISGEGNIAGSANLVGIEAVVLNGTGLTITDDNLATYIANGLLSITGSADSSKIVIQATAGDVVDLSALSLTTLQSITVDAIGGAGNITLKLTDTQIGNIGALAASTGDTLTVNTTVAGFSALGTKAGAATVTITDTLENLLAAGSSIAGVTASLGELSVAQALDALETGATVTYTVKDTAANLALASKAVFDQATKITATTDATAAQSVAIDGLLDVSTFTPTVISGVSNVVYNVVDTAEMLATQSSGLGDASRVTATTAANSLEAEAIFAAAAAGVVLGTLSYQITDTIANLVAGVADTAENGQLDALNAATSVSISNTVTDIADVAAVNAALNSKAGGLSKVAAGYAVSDSYADLTGANVAIASAAGKVTVTDVIDVTKANAIEALTNSGTNSYTVSDSTTALLAASSAVVSAAASVNSNSATLTPTQLNNLVAKFGATKFSDSSLAIVGTAAELASLTAAALAELGAPGTLAFTVGSKPSLADIVALKATLGTTYAAKLPAYAITDTVANLTAGVADTANLAVLNSATAVNVSDSATVAQIANLNTKLAGAAGGLSAVAAGYTLSDTAAKLSATGDANVTRDIVDSAVKIVVSDATTVARISTIATYFTVTGDDAVLGTDVVYSLKDSAAAVIADAAVRAGASAISVTDKTVDVSTATTLTGYAKFDGIYTIRDGVAALNTANGSTAGKALLAGAQSVILSADAASLTGVGGDAARAVANKVVLRDTLAALGEVTAELKTVVNEFEINANVDITDVAAVNALSASKTTIYTVNAASYAQLTSAAAGVATFVSNAAGVTVSDAVTVAKAETIVGLASGSVSYNIVDTAAKLAAASASILARDANGAVISGGASDSVVNVAQATILKALGITGYTITDTAANVAAATASVVIGAAGGNGAGVTLSDNGQSSMSVAVAQKVYGTDGQSLGYYDLVDSAANMAGASANLIGFARNVTTNTVATYAQADTLAQRESMGTITFDVKATAAELLSNSSRALNAARNVEVSDATSVADAVSLQAGSNSGTLTYAITQDTAANFVAQIDNANSAIKAAAIAAVEAATGKVIVTGAATAAQAVKIAALTKSVEYSISDTAAGLGATTVTTAALNEAINITVSDAASAALASTLLNASNTGTVTFSGGITGKSADLATLVKATTDTVASVTATDAATVAQASAFAKLSATLTFNLKDTAANLSASTAATTVDAAGVVTVSDAASVAQITAIAASYTVTGDDATLGTHIVYSLSDTYSNLMANSDLAGDVDADAVITGATKVTVSDGPLTVAQAVALKNVHGAATKYVYTIVDNDAAIVAAMGTNPDVLLAATTVSGSDAIALAFENVAGVITLVGTESALAALASELTASTVRNLHVVSVAELDADPLGYSTLGANDLLRVKDTYANLTAGNALVATAASVQVTDTISVAHAATVNGFNALDADTLYGISDTASNLAPTASDAAAVAAVLNKAQTVVASGTATFAQAAKIATSTSKLTYSISDVDTAYAAGGLNKATNITITGTAGLTSANAATVLAATNTGTTTIAKVVGTAAELAALTKGANDTITLAALNSNTAATVAEAVKMASLATTASYALNDSAKNLAAASSAILNGASTNGTAKAIVANTAATVAEATIIDAAAPADAATSFAIADKAANLLAADVSLLAKSNATIALTDTTLSAADATALRALDTANTTFAIDVSGKSITDTAENLKLSANAGAVAAAASIVVSGAVSVADAKAIDLLTAQTVTYSLSDPFTTLGLNANLATVNAATNVVVTDEIFVSQAAIADSWTNTGTLTFTIRDSAANLRDAKAANSALLGAATAVKVSGTATVAQAGFISEISNLSGGYTITDTASNVYNALNARNSANATDRETLTGATSVTLSTAATVAQAVGAAGQRGLADVAGLSYQITDVGSTIAAALATSNAADLTAATQINLLDSSGLTIAQYNLLTSTFGTKFKAFDHDSNATTAGRYYITDSADQIVRAPSVATAATTLVVKDTYANLYGTNGDDGQLADVKNVLGITNVNIELTDASITVTQLNAIDAKNGTGSIVGFANLSGTAAELAAVDAAVLAARSTISVTDAAAAAVTAANLATIGGATTAVVTVANAVNISGSEAEVTAALVTEASKVLAATANVSVTGGAIAVASANAIAASTSGVVTATLSTGNLASFATLAETGNAYTVTVNDANATNVAATDLSTLGGKTTGTVTVSNAVNVQGTGAQVIAALVTDATKVTASTATVAVSDTISVADANSIAGTTSGAVTATLSTGDLASFATLAETGNAYTITVNDAASTAVAATALSTLGGKTTAPVTVSNAVAISGSAAQVTAALVTADTSVVASTATVTINDAAATALTAAALSAIGGATGGTVTVSNAVNISGTGAEVTAALVTADTKVVAATANVTVSDAISVATANSYDSATSGVVTATISDNADTTLIGLTGTANAYTVAVTGTASAANLLSIDGKTTVQVGATGVTTLTGTVADIKSVIATPSTIATSGTYAVTIDAAASVAAVDLNSIDAATTGLVNATAVDLISGSVNQALDATDDQTALSTAGDVDISLSAAATAAAADLNTLDGRTTGLVTATGIAAITGTLADALNATDDQAALATNANVNITLDAAATAAAADLNTLDGRTGGLVTATGIAAITGTLADALTATATANQGQLDTAGNVNITLDAAATAAAADLNTLDGQTTGLVTATGIAAITGSLVDALNATDDQGALDTAAGVNITLDAAASADAFDLNTLDGRTTGQITATGIAEIVGNAAAVVIAAGSAGLDTAADVALTVTDGNATAAQANTLGGLTTGVVTATVDADTATNLVTATAANGDANDALTFTVNGGTAAAADLITLDGRTSVAVGATAITLITGTAAAVINAVDDQTTIDTAADVALTVNAGTATAAQANTLGGFTTGVVTATVDADTAAALVAATATNGDANDALTFTVNGGTAAAADLITLDGRTSVAVGATGITLITGSVADALNATDDQATIDTADNVNITLAAGTATATELNTLDGRTTGLVNATAISGITGSAAEFATLINAQNSGQVTLSGSFNATITGTSTVAQVNTVDVITSGTVVADDITDTFTAIAGASAVLINGATAVTATDTSAANNIDLSMFTKGITIQANGGNDTITAGSGNDTIVSGEGDDTITNYTNDGTHVDAINFTGTEVISTTSAANSHLVAAEEYFINASGLITFVADVQANPAAAWTLAEKRAAIQADATLSAANSVSVFEDGADSYVFYAGATTGTADDQFIRLQGGSAYKAIALVGGGAGITLSTIPVQVNAIVAVTDPANTLDAFTGVEHTLHGLSFTHDFFGLNHVSLDGFSSIDLSAMGGASAASVAATTGGNGQGIYAFPTSVAGPTITAVAGTGSILVGDMAAVFLGTGLELVGDTGNDLLLGTLQNDTLQGNAGNDIIMGGNGADIITGGLGADVLTGGAGNDVYVYAGTADVDANETITEAGGGGTDRIRVTTGNTDFSAMAAANFDEIEELQITGAFTATFTGAQLTGETVSLIGNAASVQAVVITATANAVTDLSNVSAGADWTAGTDTVTINGADGSSEAIIGTATADTISGGTGVDQINGGAGDDRILADDDDNLVDGAGGNDTMVLAADATFGALDLLNIEIVELADGVDLTVDYTDVTGANNIATVTGVAGGAIETLIVVGRSGGGGATLNYSAANLTLTNVLLEVQGGTDDEVITGTAGADTISGGAGADVINGGAGSDTYVFAAIGDLVTLATTVAVAADTDADGVGATTEELTNADSYDVLTWAAGDIIDLSGIDADTGNGGDQAFTFSTDNTAVAGTSDAINTTGTAGQAILQTGTYDAVNGEFTHTAAGPDGLLVINDGTNVAYVVIVGGAGLLGTDFVL